MFPSFVSVSLGLYPMSVHQDKSQACIWPPSVPWFTWKGNQRCGQMRVMVCWHRSPVWMTTIWAICLQWYGLDLLKGWLTMWSCCAAAQCVSVPQKLPRKSLKRTRQDIYSPKGISAKCLENRTWGFNLFQQLLMELRCCNTEHGCPFHGTKYQKETRNRNISSSVLLNCSGNSPV